MRRMMYIGLIGLLLIGGGAFAAIRISASFRADDGITGGGGAAVSTSLKAPQQAIGQSSGLSQSASYRN